MYRETKTHALWIVTFLENRAVYEIIWKKYGGAREDTDDNIIKRMLFVCRISKAKHTGTRIHCM